LSVAFVAYAIEEESDAEFEEFDEQVSALLPRGKGGKGKGKVVSKTSGKTTAAKTTAAKTTGAKGKKVKVPVVFSGSTLAKARSGLQTTVLNDFNLYVVGGTNGPKIALNNVEVYNIKQGVWDSLTPLPTPRNGVGVVGLNGELWAIAGIGNNDVFTNIVEIFTPPAVAGGLGVWRSGPSLANARWNLGAVNLCNEIYAIGGFDIIGANSTNQIIEGIAVVEVWSPIDNVWRIGTPLPDQGRAAFGSVILNGEIWVIGGELQFSQGTTQTPTVSVISYSPKTDVWTNRADLPLARVGFGATVINNKIYVAGGRTTAGVPIADIHIYDPVTGGWTVSSQVRLPDTRFNNAVGSLFNNLFVLGGRSSNNNNNFLASVEAFVISI